MLFLILIASSFLLLMAVCMRVIFSAGMFWVLIKILRYVILRRLSNHFRYNRGHSHKQGHKQGYKGGMEAPARSNMSREDARQILGLKKDYNKSEVNSAYKKFVKLYHPDKGGSNYIMQQIIEAKNVLLNDKNSV